MTSAEGASENVRVFCRTAVCDVTFSNSRGEVPPPPFAPPAGAHGHDQPRCVGPSFLWPRLPFRNGAVITINAYVA